MVAEGDAALAERMRREEAERAALKAAESAAVLLAAEKAEVPVSANISAAVTAEPDGLGAEN